MSLAQLIRERRSIRRFNRQPVAQELVVELLQRAVRLYGADEEPRWRCIYAGTEEARRRLADSMIAKTRQSRLVKLIPNKMVESFIQKFADIPASLIVVADADPDRRRQEENYASACGTLQLLQLLGWERGLGMAWDTERLIQNELFFENVGIGASEQFVGIMHMGYFDKTPRGRGRTPAEKKWTVFRADAR
ncbi:nitroreductase family protein [Paenibacillus hodogayensis]|uniref:Nitroreductase family protein n=1 Tax=Paenibacillus hodogayensis TaxID=279208 RepID=A0ABV5W3X8_9BACL